MSKILIIGGSGFVGSNLAWFFAPRSSVVVTYLTTPITPDLLLVTKSVQVDITDIERISSVVEAILPDIVIHATDNKNVRYCEKHPDEAYQTKCCRNIECYPRLSPYRSKNDLYFH